jgi:hypothetical protein
LGTFKSSVGTSDLKVFARKRPNNCWKLKDGLSESRICPLRLSNFRRRQPAARSSRTKLVFCNRSGKFPHLRRWRFFVTSCAGYVREMICEVMAAEVTEFCGLKHSPSTSDITIGRAKVTIQRGYVSLLKKDTATCHIFVRAKRAVKQASREKPRRWVVEMRLGWLDRFRAILTRFEKRVDNHIGVLRFACVYFKLRRLVVFGLVPKLFSRFRMRRTRILNSSSDHAGADKGELKGWQPSKPKLS